MHSPLDPCCAPELSSTCPPLPSGLTRLRYFFGKRLTAADLTDEQRYHGVKHALHLRYSHGRGVVTGLWPEAVEERETWVRVRAGLAIDACGRSILVPFDQCIDLRAWLEEERARRLAIDPAPWPAGLVDAATHRMRVWIVLRYRECKSGAEPAPVDVCGCDGEGSDYGRVREQFELSVIDARDIVRASARDVPSDAEIDRALEVELGAGLGTGRAALDRAVRTTARDAIDRDAIRIAELELELDAAHAAVVRIVSIDARVAPVRLPTRVIERWLETLERTLPDAEASWTGPRLATLRARPPAALADPFVIELDVVGALVATTVDGRDDLFAIRRLDAGGWASPTAPLTARLIAATATSPERVELSCTDAAFFVSGARYRLSRLDASGTAPPVDTLLRELGPRGATYRFALSPALAIEPLVGAP